MPFDNSPIAAIATAPGRGGIGVVRLSGKNIAALIPALCKLPAGATLQARQATYTRFVNASGGLIDQGLAIYFNAPNSYTGEDVLELQILLTRRDTYMKFLYEREQDFSQQLEGRDWRIASLQEREQELLQQIAENEKYLRAINDSPSLRVGKAITWPARKLRGLRTKE